VRRVYLELRERSQFSEPERRRQDALVEPLDPCTVEEYRWLYGEVGARWSWVDRRRWSDDQLARHLARPEITIWVMRIPPAAEIAGFAELERHADGDVEISYFGLRPRYIGQRLGAELLTHAVQQAWKRGAGRVWLHTCSLDSPHALPNYLARGFTQFHEEWYTPPNA
jgi:GNAT superfamily N-acetyltransferase